MYNYLKSIKEDVKNYLEENYNVETIEEINKIDTNNLYDELFVEDSVTGNASGSYTFSTYQAEENLCHNLDLLKEALESFGSDIDYLESPEACDVTIRCYLLGQVIPDVLEELQEKHGATVPF